MFKLSKNRGIYFVTTKTRGYVLYKLDTSGSFSSDNCKMFTLSQVDKIKKYLTKN